VPSFPSPSITSARLELREFSLADADLVREVAANAEHEALPPGAPSDPERLDDWLAADDRLPLPDGTAVHLMMLDRSLGRIIGSISVFHADWETRSAEIGYGVRADQRGKGYAPEALAAVARWALTDGGLQRVWLSTIAENVASQRVAEKAGFQLEGTLRRAGLEDDGLHDLVIFSLLDDEV
jgi:RimJ/RimL family protein N-acetyltransferase